MRHLLMGMLLLGMLQRVAAAPPTREEQAIECIASFLQSTGDGDSARVLREGFKASPPLFRFGAVPENDNAETDVTGDHRTVLNRSAIEQVLESRGFDRYRMAAEWARTVVHERKHQGQDALAWRVSYWSDVARTGHACEREAWEQGFQANFDWMRQAARELNDPGKNAEERAAAARRLEILAESFASYRNAYKARYGTIGLISKPDGDRLTLEEALAEAAALQEKARKAIALEQDRTGRELNQPPEGWVATYQGHFTGDASGTIKFVLRGKSLSGEYRGREHKRGAEINGAAPDSLVKYDPVTGEFSALFMGSRSSTIPDGMGMLLNFKVNGRVTRQRVSGTWQFTTDENLRFRGSFEARL